MDETPVGATQKYVEDIIWPADKETVLEAMERNGAPEDVLQTVRQVDRPRFTGPNDVHSGLWENA